MTDQQVTGHENEKHFSQFGRQGYYAKEVAFLNAGAPGTDMLKMLPPLIEAATSHLMKNELEGDCQLFQYGVENGDWNFQHFLSLFLSKEYGDAVRSEQLFLTGGATSGLWLILSSLFPPGSIVFVEDPSYFCALEVFAHNKMNVVPVKTDDDGIIVEDFEKKLVHHFSENPTPCNPPLRAMAYLIPVFQNPTGSILPADRCQRIITLARKYGITVMCDDVYNLLHYDDSPICPKRLFSFDEPSSPDYVGNVISNGTFSKFLGPGLRIGWMEIPLWLKDKLIDFGVLVSGGGLNTFTSGIISSLLALGLLQSHLQKMKTIFKTHMDATVDLLKKQLPPGCKLKSLNKGGYFLWIELPADVDAISLLPFAKKEYQVTFMIGKWASPTGGFNNFIRICISFYPLDVLLPAVERLCQAILEFQLRSKDDPNFWKAYK